MDHPILSFHEHYKDAGSEVAVLWYVIFAKQVVADTNGDSTTTLTENGFHQLSTSTLGKWLPSLESME